MTNQLFTVKEAAEFLKMSQSTIYFFLREGVLTGIRYGGRGKIFIDKESIETYMKGQKYAPRKNNRSAN